MRWLAVLALIGAGCADDPSLQIDVEPPAGDAYQPLIARTVVTVYESELDSLTCAQIELGDVTEDLLLGAAVAEQTVFADGTTEGTLDDISRLGTKLIAARLYTATGVLVAAGCAEAGDVEGALRIEVPTTVAATVAIDPASVDDPYGKQITIVDPLGESLAGREVRWRLFAPAGAAPATTDGVIVDPDDPTVWDVAAPACTDARGIATTRLVPPATVTGFAARFRVSWPATPIGVSSGFVQPGIGLQVVADLPPAHRCAIRTAGERRVVCAEGASTVTPRGHRFEIVPGALGNYDVIDRGTVALAGRVAGVFAADEPEGAEVYAVLADGTVANLFGATPLAASTCPGCAIDDFRVAPACGDEPARLILHSTAGAPIRGMPVHGGAANALQLPPGLDPATVSLNNVGCVTTITGDGVEHDVQLVALDVITGGGAATIGTFRCGPRTCSVTLPFPRSAVGFLRAGSATAPEHQLVGTTFDVAGAEVVSWVLRPTFDGNTFLLIDRQRFTAAAPPEQILVGALDADAEPDLVWSMRGGRTSILQVSYAHAIEDGSRLSALASLGSAIDELALGDLDGDGFDDLVGASANAFLVLPSNVVGPAVPAVTEDSACGG